MHFCLNTYVRTSSNEVNILPPLYWVVILSQIGLFIPFLVRHCHNICRYFSRIGPWKSSDPSSFILNVSRIPTTSVFSVMESWWNHLHSKEIMLLRSSYCDQIGTLKGEGGGDSWAGTFFVLLSMCVQTTFWA